MKKVFSRTIIVILIILIGGCNVSKGKKDRSKFGGKAKNHKVELGTIVIKLEETGEIQPIREIEQKSQVSGELVKFYVEEGDYINKGDLIAEIIPDFNQAEAILRVNSNLKLAEIDHSCTYPDRWFGNYDNFKCFCNYVRSKIELET